MKKILILVASIFTLISCNKSDENGFSIDGEAKGFDNGTKVFIQVMDEQNNSTSIDTAVITNGNFKFTGDVKDYDLAYIKFDMEGSIPFFIEKGNIKINYVKDSVHKSTTTGTYNNDLLTEFNKKSNEVGKNLMKFQKENLQKMKDAQQNNDTVTINAIMKKHDSYQEELNTFSEAFINKNKDAILSVLLIENFIKQKSLEISETKRYYDELTENVKNSKSGQRVKKLLDAIFSVEVGKKAPDFSAPSPDGKTISLKESLGKVTIIDFWASWCGPCRMENPNVVAMYNELHEKGLNIIGVSLDREEAKWKEAIEKDGLTWNHVSNLKFWQDPIAETYNVKAIPATFILDANGVIVAKDLRGAELKAKVEELLNK